MAESNEVIRYVVEIDTSTAEAKITALGEKGEKQVKEGAEPGKEADNVLDILKNVQSRIRAGAVAGMAFAQTPGQAIAAGGAVVGGPMGEFISAVGLLSDRFQGLAQDLSLFDAGIFEATTGMEFFMMGWKIELAEAVSEVMQDMYTAFQGFMIDILPTVIELFTIMGDVLPQTIKSFGSLAGGIGDFLGWLNDLWGRFAEWSQNYFAQALLPTIAGMEGIDLRDPKNRALHEDLINQMSEQIFQGRKFSEVLGDGVEEFNRMIGAVTRTTEAYDAMERGFEISRASLTALEDFGYFGAKQGAQLSESPPSVMHAEIAGGGDADATTRSFPRPSPAAVNFKVSDQINIQTGDETQMLAELMLWKQNVMDMVNGLHAGQWSRLAEARLGGYMAQAG